MGVWVLNTSILLVDLIIIYHSNMYGKQYMGEGSERSKQ